MSTEFTSTPLPLAQEFMAKRLITVRPETDAAEAINLLLKHRISGMPVVDQEGNYLGVFSEKSCMRVLDQTAKIIGPDSLKTPVAREFMTSRLVCLSPDQDVFDAISLLLSHRFSGAPIATASREFLGVFSEKTSMSVLINSAYDGVPGGKVAAFMNPDPGRLVSEETSLFDVTQIFIKTPYRRLPVISGNQIVGQISRRDVLQNSRILSAIVRYQVESNREKPISAGDSIVFWKAHRQLPSTSVSAFMDTSAKTITTDYDLLAIAGVFLNTPYRRLPIVENGKVLGQVSRRDVLRASLQLIKPIECSESGTLYLSAVGGAEQKMTALS
ncbi:inosine 5'-monophosphate dehydrogenase [Thalassoglobus neptunius]|uniref:Inosine 5'-monophosphate dehydrogenase n=1 Tax=Thalassoglobus neptunius TaxID=1938619 RepID=A0A5C5X0S4_9PLAN|nr:CBS domain-containing protein [Thalassoglobus neptunius]TWT56744.1 inosine 5'-monophosphate dehydrogenase [Thalassoglobus neptunius]